MTDQTRWGIHEVQTRNKAIKYQKDLVSRAMEHVVKMDESGITDLMIQIEAEYERKYGNNKAQKTILQVCGTEIKKIFFFSEIKCTLCPLGCFSLVYKAKWWTGGGHFQCFWWTFGTLFIVNITILVKTQTARDLVIFKKLNL